MQILSVVLAGGQGKRMKSKLYKVLHKVCGKPMVGHVTDTLAKLDIARTVVVVGCGAEMVRGYLGDRVEFALQEEQLGTGHAVLQAKPLLQDEDGTTIVVYGDTPLITAESLQEMLNLHHKHGAAATVLTANFADPSGLGRVIRDANGRVDRIVEQKDCTSEEAAVHEINAGTYIFDNRKLFEALERVTNHNAQKEYYLTDVIGIFKDQGEAVLAYCTPDASEAIGVNDRVLLAEAERLMRERIMRRHMLNGVTVIDPAATYVEDDVQIGADTVLYPGCVLKAGTVIGADCTIGPHAEIAGSTLADGVTVKQSVVHDALVGPRTAIGPFAYLRPGSNIGADVKIGDFVEIKNAVLGDGTKVSHLSYVGDAQIGRNVNVGCGAITVNYDGFQKHQTVVEDEAFVGSNVNLIAPVKIGKRAYVVAGSTITNDVPDNDLAIARERQTNKPGYADKLRQRILSRKKTQ